MLLLPLPLCPCLSQGQLIAYDIHLSNTSVLLNFR
jgi:hypothetical protein